MAIITFEVSNKLERIRTKERKNPWKWEARIFFAGLTIEDRRKLTLPLSGGANDILDIQGVVDHAVDVKEIRRMIVDMVQVKVQEMREKIAIPKTETISLPENEKCKAVLTTLEKFSANQIA